MGHTNSHSQHRLTRREFVSAGLAIGAGAAGAGLLPGIAAQASDPLTPGDAAILRFLAALEILETDFWQQYNELGGIQDSEVPGGSGNNAYTRARWHGSTPTWRSTSTTTPKTSSPTSTSSTTI